MTQDAYSRSSLAKATVSRWEKLIDALARAAKGEALDTEAARALETMENTPQWAGLARSLWRVLSGERDTALYAELDHIDALVVRTLLQRIASDTSALDNDGASA